MGAYLFGGALRAAVRASGSRRARHARVPLRAPVRDDDRRARHRLDRPRQAPPRRARPPSAFPTCARSARTDRHGRADATLARRGAPACGRASGGAADPGRDRRHGRAQLRPRPPGDDPEPERGRGAPRLVARRTGRFGWGRGSRTPRSMHGEVGELLPALAEASRTVGSPQIRNRGTIGGNLGTASPAGDALPPLLVEGAEVEVASARGRAAGRAARLPRSGRSGTRSQDDELIVAVHVAPSGQPQTFMKVGPRNAMVIAVCSLAVVADRERGELRASFGSAGPVPGLVTLSAGRGRLVPRAGRGCGQPDRRRPRHRCLPSPRPRRARATRAREVPRVKIALVVNGERHEADVWAGESLLTTLRDRLGLPGSKNACEQGECGSCSVLLDGTLVCACLVLARQADGHEVVTVEGLAVDGRLHRVQEAFVETGAVQCGFCTPGLVVAAAELLRRNPDPADGRDPRGALRQPLPLHRVPEDPRRRAAGRGTMSAPARTLAKGRAEVGPRRHDAVPKVTGDFAYASDLELAGMLWGRTVRSPHAHARIVSDRHLPGSRAPGCPRGADPRGRARAEDVRARVLGPARARHRPRALLRRAGRDRRGRRARAGSSCSGGGTGRVRGSRSGRRSRARDRAGAAAPRPTDHGPRLPGRPAAERRPLDRDPARRPRGEGRGRRVRRLRDRASGPDVPRAGIGPRDPGRRGWRRHPRRDPVAPRRPRPGCAVPRPPARAWCASISRASAARSVAARTSRCRSTRRCSPSARRVR